MKPHPQALAVVTLAALGLALGLWAELRRHAAPPTLSQEGVAIEGDDALVALFEGRRMPLEEVDEPAVASVPGIGPKLARSIILSRDTGAPGSSRLEVKGLGPKRRAQLARYVDISP